MRSLRGLFVFGLIWLCAAAPAFGQNDHLLITEFVVTPTAGEFIEVFNPTSATVDLSTYYLTDDVTSNNNDYVKVVNGAGALSLTSADFLVKFPDGASIAPGEAQTIAFSDTAFSRIYGKPVSYEVFSSSPGVPDMVTIAATANAGLTNGSESVVLFTWDGTSDLVQDVDYVVWGNKGTAVDKSGLAIDGPDAGTEVSTYQNDTVVANQSVVNADNDADLEPHDFGDSAQRVTLEVGEILTGGNGITGHNETSENLSFAGGSWASSDAPTPGSVALGAQLDVSPPAKITAMPGETITVPLNLTNPAAKAIDAFGLRLLFPGALLDYDTVQTAGTLTNGWLVVNGNQTGANEVTLGGFHIAATTASGVLLNLKFTVKPDATGKDSLKLGNFTDDLARATTTDGVFEIVPVPVFTAILNGDQEVPPISTPAKGQVTATLMGNQLVVTGSFSNLSSDFNAAVRGGAHLHLAPAGRNGGIQIELAATVNADQRSGTFEAANNTFTLTNDLVTALNDRKLYANIHTQTYPGGEIRGQLVPEAEAYYRANLAGSNEVPAVSSTGNGGIIFELRGNELTVSGSFKELGSNFNPNVQGGAHIHLAPAGRNGGIQLNFTTVTDADLRGGVFEAASNKFTLTPDQLAALQARRLYANVHTTTFGGGEIRGQILRLTANAFRVNFSGGNEVPPLATTGAGALMLELVDNQLTVSGAFNNLGSDFNAAVRGGAHLHLAPIGHNGGIQIELAATVNADNRSGTFEAASNTFTLTTDLVTALRGRKLYANIHTQTYAGGEIRGQVLPENYSFFTAALSARNEVQPVASTARGGVVVELSGTRMTLTGSFSDLTSDFNPNVRGGAHLHAAPAGQNGGIQIELATALDANARGGVFEAASNTFALTTDQVTALRTGGMYANVHTQTFASGEMRGQLLADPNRFPNATTITSPASDSTVVIEGSSETLFLATWSTATDPDNNLVVYLWQLSPDRQFNTVLVNRNTNTATSFSANFSDVDSILAAAGVAVGNTVKLYHRANTADGSLQSLGAIDSVNVTRGLIVSVEEREDGLPTTFALHGNYPNPFNPSTIILYDLPQANHVKLEIYNLLGKTVRTLVDAKEAPGFKHITWDGANDAGERVTSGIYIYRIETESFSATRKLTLLR